MRYDYEKPEMDVIVFKEQDVVVTSGTTVDTDGWMNPGGNLGGGDNAEESDW